MPLVNGWYMQGAEYPYEKASTYQLKTSITFALVALYKIENESTSDLALFDNRVQYYRFYLDKLFYCLGQINSRFTKISKGSPDLIALKNEYVELNRSNYKFSEAKFPLLSNKKPRNIIEHVDERNLLTIKDHCGVGGFNVIFYDSTTDMIDNLLSKRKNYPYTLDLRNMIVYFYNIQDNSNNNKEFQINLTDLKEEILQLKKNVNALDKYLNS